METPLELIKKMRETIMKHQQANGFNTVFDFLNEDLEDLEKALAKLHFIETLLSEESAKKMALEYTGAEEEYQGFILACGVIAEKIKQNL